LLCSWLEKISAVAPRRSFAGAAMMRCTQLFLAAKK
jgi:hypothetical protein